MNMKVCSLKSGVVAVFPSSSSSSLRFLSPSLNLRSSNSFTKLKIRAEIPIIPKFVKAYSPCNRPPPPPPPPPAMAPLQLKSPSGKLLLHTLTAHPHLLPSTIDQQLDRLEADAAAADRHDNLEEILYCIIVHKFTENSIRMITMIPTCQLDYQEEDRHKLEAAHTDDAMDMIEGHLTFVQDKFGAHPGKLRLGKLYSASVKFGYYLKRVDERFQLEKKMDTLPTVHVGDVESAILYDCDDKEDDLDNLSYGLRAYIRGLDEETLRRFATVRSEEAMSLIGKHEKALFGDSAMSALASGIGSSGLAMLVLEAVAFGSFLWEAECYIEESTKKKFGNKSQFRREQSHRNILCNLHPQQRWLVLSHTLHYRSHLLPVVIDQQIEQLESNTNASTVKEEILVERIYCQKIVQLTNKL